MWARLWKPRHQAWLMAKPLVESVLLDSEPPAGLVRRVVLARYKEPPEHPCQQQTEQILLDSAHLPSSPLTFRAILQPAPHSQRVRVLCFSLKTFWLCLFSFFWMRACSLAPT